MEHLSPVESAEDLHGRIERLELLLREADHRIANSLQLASSLAGQEARAIEDPLVRARLLATQSYIGAIAGVHQLLSKAPVGEPLPLDDYLQRLVVRLKAAMANGGVDRRISLRADPVEAAPDVAVWIGMIVIELVSNACKYAYPETEPGEIRIALAAQGGGFQLDVEDDGPGVEAGRASFGSGLGSRMISTMARRMGAEFRYDGRSAGTRAVLAAPAPTCDAAIRPSAAFAPPAGARSATAEARLQDGWTAPGACIGTA